MRIDSPTKRATFFSRVPDIKADRGGTTLLELMTKNPPRPAVVTWFRSKSRRVQFLARIFA